MIPAFDDTAPYIWAAYAFSAAVLGGLIASVFARASAARQRLDAVEREDSHAP